MNFKATKRLLDIRVFMAHTGLFRLLEETLVWVNITSWVRLPQIIDRSEESWSAPLSSHLYLDNDTPPREEKSTERNILDIPVIQSPVTLSVGSGN
ncbi:hypothetical protein E3N88_37879 [Mikania micrantha]|uniref:Uncharacterized protein n=1 Tax=Mikania micrantha TaxID=192012 RepID=A0A5N6LUQ9_9ASTR|nr:hypothetical protein E3N88_37879 [Mikania micrantha]